MVLILGPRLIFYLVRGRYKPGIEIGIMQGMYLVLHHVPSTTTYQALVCMIGGNTYHTSLIGFSIRVSRSEAHGPSILCIPTVLY